MVHVSFVSLYLCVYRILATCPELMELSVQSALFKLPNANTVDPNSSTTVSSSSMDDGSYTSHGGLPNTPQGMAQRFDVPYLGKLPMDPNMMRACEEGKSFLEAYPDSVAAVPFAAVVQQIVQMTPDV